MSTPGEFFSEHRKLIDARKAHLMRVGITPPDMAPLRDVMPSQAQALAMPPAHEAPLLDASHPAAVPKSAPVEYNTPKLPRLAGVNASADEA